ncbi:MAG: hypothetical protein V7K21_02300 [Nostoc sp.]
MEELLELRQFLEQGKIHEALLLVNELEEMSLSDKTKKLIVIRTYARTL